MTQEYRDEQLANARKKLEAARVRVAAARTNKARREAYEDVEFWGNKVAFFGCLAPEAM
jgi:hypothetical protein